MNMPIFSSSRLHVFTSSHGASSHGASSHGASSGSSSRATLPLAPRSRRRFLRQLVFGREPVVNDPGANVLVCIFLRGGADTLNIVVPYGDRDYYANRPTISIPPPPRGQEKPDAAIRLDDFYGLHPKMKPLMPVYKEGRFGIVQAVGSDNSSGSHFEAQDQIEHGEASGKNVGGGWLGRHLRVRAESGGSTAGRGGSPLSGIAIGPTLPESLRGARRPARSNPSMRSSSPPPPATRRPSPTLCRSSMGRRSASSATKAPRPSICSSESRPSATSPTRRRTALSTLRTTSARDWPRWRGS